MVAGTKVTRKVRANSAQVHNLVARGVADTDSFDLSELAFRLALTFAYIEKLNDLD